MANVNLVCLAVLTLCCGAVLTTPLLGQHQCSWGPSFWCSNITNAKGCGAVPHCIKAVWEKQHYPEDTDSICKICTDMVTEARDQLESNQTQEDLKAVFEGSCKLIPIDVVSGECCKLVDEFIPELVETLASQMNPQVVCSVAGLCNSERIDKMLEDMNKNKTAVARPSQTCQGCYTVIGEMRENFDRLSYVEVLESLLRVCFKFGSFSDGCATAVFTNFEDIYQHLTQNFYPENVCLVAGTCVDKFHRHEEPAASVEITPMGNVGMLKTGNDLTCDLCEQLVKHMRDVLITNTTEVEFKRVLEGLCKQTGAFKDECLAIVDQYSSAIFDFLSKELNSNDVCLLAGICKKNKMIDGPIAPLVSRNTAELGVRLMKPSSDKKVIIGKDEYNSYHQHHDDNVAEKTKPSVSIINPEVSQLPIERMMVQIPHNENLCSLCQYFLHFVQVELSDAKTEEKIKKLVENTCTRLPNSIEGECEAFVEAYGNAVIALLVQNIDPSQVCPALTICPKEPQVMQVEVLMSSTKGDKPNCPLCLFAVEQLQSMLKNNKTEDSIQHALENLCSHLSSKLKAECTDFVDAYAKQLVEMLVADFTAQEVCVYLKLCTDTHPDASGLEAAFAINKFHSQKKLMADGNNFKRPMLPASMLEDISSKDGQIATNEIPDNTVNGKPLIYAKPVIVNSGLTESPQCLICEFVMTQLDKELKDKKTDDQIKSLVHAVCNHLPKSISKECNDFVTKYADAVIMLLTEELAPEDVCATLSLCDQKKVELQSAILDCAVCEEAIDIVAQILSNPSVDRKLSHIIEKTCYALPARYLDRCKNLMNIYGESIVHLVSVLANSREVCSDIGMCGRGSGNFIRLINSSEQKRVQRDTANLGTKKCSWGPSYWCENEDQANECHAISHCRVRVWKAESPPTKN